MEGMLLGEKRNEELKYLRKELLDAYNNDLKKCRDIPELRSPLIGIADVLQAHYILADYFTDESAGVEIESMLAGLRNEDLLASALCRQTVSYEGKQKYTDPIDICSTLFYGLVKDHAFHDGNKRTALLVLLSQLNNYGIYPKNTFKEFENLVLAIASNSLSTKYNNSWKKFKKQEDPDIKCISYMLRKLTERKDRSFHLNINMKEFCNALEKHGVKYTIDNMKVKLVRTITFVKIPIKKYSYTIKFYGWTRPVEAKMARDTFNELHLTEEFSSFKKLVQGEKSLYAIINQFEIPLRRLKDE